MRDCSVQLFLDQDYFNTYLTFLFNHECSCSLLPQVGFSHLCGIHYSIEDVYDNIPDATARFEELNALFKEKYGSLPEFYVRAPGRVNLIGEHIDYHKYYYYFHIILLAILSFPWQLQMT